MNTPQWVEWAVILVIFTVLALVVMWFITRNDN